MSDIRINTDYQEIINALRQQRDQALDKVAEQAGVIGGLIAKIKELSDALAPKVDQS